MCGRARTERYSSRGGHRMFQKNSLLVLEVLKFSNAEVVRIVEQKKRHFIMSKPSYMHLVKN